MTIPVLRTIFIKDKSYFRVFKGKNYFVLILSCTYGIMLRQQKGTRLNSRSIISKHVLVLVKEAKPIILYHAEYVDDSRAVSVTNGLCPKK